MGSRYPHLSPEERRKIADWRDAKTPVPKMQPCLDHRHLELDNNNAERGTFPVALGGKNYLFVGSKSGGNAAAITYTLIEAAKRNGIEPQAWLSNVLSRIAYHPANRVDELVPWHFIPHSASDAAIR